MKQTDSPSLSFAGATANAKRVALFGLAALAMAACSETMELKPDPTQLVNGTAKIDFTTDKASLPAFHQFDGSTLHYPSKDNSGWKGYTIEGPFTGTDELTFDTAGDNPLYWQETLVPTKDNPATFYLTTKYTNALPGVSDLERRRNEPLWAKCTVEKNDRAPLNFGALKCRLAKLSIKLITSQPIKEESLILDINAKGATQKPPFDRLAWTAGEQSAPHLVELFTSDDPVTDTQFIGSILLPQQEFKDEDTAIRINYERTLSNGSLVRKHLTIPFSDLIIKDAAGKVIPFALVANQHLTLTIALGIGDEVDTIAEIVVSAWQTGVDSALDATPDTEDR
jgi:hypothetical protein